MKSIRFCLMALCLISTGYLTVDAQTFLADPKSSTIQLGYGVIRSGLSFKRILSMNETEQVDGFSSKLTYKLTGPIHFRYEYMLNSTWGMGLSANYESGKMNYHIEYQDIDDELLVQDFSYSYSSVNAILRFNKHWLKENEKLDVYTGFGIGYFKTKLAINLDGTFVDAESKAYVEEFNKIVNKVINLIPIALEDVVGVKYAFNPSFGAYAELGLSKSFLQMGMFFKFGNNKGYNRSSFKYW